MQLACQNKREGGNCQALGLPGQHLSKHSFIVVTSLGQTIVMVFAKVASKSLILLFSEIFIATLISVLTLFGEQY